MDLINDKLSIKNLLFTKALPNYVIPIPLNGHKVFSCTDCGDKFIFESSFNDHVNRKSVKISYMCRHCGKPKTFYNRCNLLFHIRSHAFKTATINVTDLKVEPLALSCYRFRPLPPSDTNSTPSTVATETQALANSETSTGRNEILVTGRNVTYSAINCLECKMDLTSTGVAYKDRATHYMQYSNAVYSCPVCLFALPTLCALKTHLRVHLRCPPYYCPECGVHLANKNIHYPYNHDCEGFKMMRATARLKCESPDCRIFHPNDYKEHMKDQHMKKVHKCPYCVVACFNEESMQNHLKTHQADTKALIFYKCELCPGKFVLQSRIEGHLKSHKIISIFPCWPCGANFKDVSLLLHHFQENHNKNDSVREILSSISSEFEMYTKDLNKPKRIYRVVKRCDQCWRSFTYRCQYNEIHNLPNECPYKCSSPLKVNVIDRNQSNSHITCHLCKTNISQDWKDIKRHYAALHKTHKCLDARIVVNRIDIQKYLSPNNISTPRKGNKKIIDKKISRKSRKRQNNKSLVPNVDVDDIPLAVHSSQSTVGEDLYVCNMCGEHYGDKVELEKHMKSHMDPCMAYQCMECGQSFVVKPTFSKHMMLEHNISDIDEYVKEKQCYNINALMKYQSSDVISNEPLRENQCMICREDFEGPEDLAKHFRVHGMAFLLKNNTSKT